MTNLEIYNLLNNLGMIDEDGDNLTAETFTNYTCKDVVEVLNFVDDLFLYNDDKTIKKFIVALLMKNYEKESNK